jgi:hypothetical protein
MVIKRLAWAACLAPVLSGCNIFYYAAKNTLNEPVELCDQLSRTHHLRKQAKECWQEVRKQYPRKAFTPEFRDGFIDGYVDYLDRGGNAVLPAVPPKRYTRNDYLTAEGHDRIRDYFLGFKYGLDVALATGQRQFLTVPVLLAPQHEGPQTFNIQSGNRPDTPQMPPGPMPDEPPKPGPPLQVPPPPGLGTAPGRPRPFAGATPAVPPPAAGPAAPPGPVAAGGPTRAPDKPKREPNPPVVKTPAPRPPADPGARLGPPAPTAMIPDPDALPAPNPPLPIPVIPPAPDPTLELESGSKAGALPGEGPVAPSGFTIRLPEPPDEVPSLPEHVPTPSVLDELPVIPANHMIPAPLPANHTIPQRK